MQALFQRLITDFQEAPPKQVIAREQVIPPLGDGLLQLQLGFNFVHPAFDAGVIRSRRNHRAAAGGGFFGRVAAAFFTHAIQHDFVIPYRSYHFIARIGGIFQRQTQVTKGFLPRG